MRLVRKRRGLLIAVGVPVLSVALALVVVGVLLAANGSDPVAAYRSMVSAAFGSTFALSTTLIKTLPRLLPALGIALALRAGLWNVGAEGQIYVGALAAAGVALFGPVIAFPVGAGLALVAAATAGAAWGAIPGALRAGRGISEVITSLMLVYVAIHLTNYLVEGPWLVSGSTFPATDAVPTDLRLPIIWSGTLLNAGVLVALAATAVVAFVLNRTVFGLQLRAIGSNDRASRVAGLSVGRVTIAAMAASGALAGLAGGIEVLGARGRLIEGFSPGYGFEAIAIALLGRLNPLGIVGAALLFGALDAGGAGLQTTAEGVSSAIVPITEGLAVVFVLIGLGIVEMLGRRREARAMLEGSQAADRPVTHDGLAGPVVGA
ncbi:MAG TPA: ABC transporter permease [Baekduia sp.]|uniref:ABC transporter permease n=1 Tax=Baekduia sp. TaxID=2600305 RepID=UPI002C40934F|nr:ABC transporter permease [Baekduia sp.]HMJ35599.1 ABC transporter permease [Baekduia sp.]